MTTIRKNLDINIETIGNVEIIGNIGNPFVLKGDKWEMVEKGTKLAKNAVVLPGRPYSYEVDGEQKTVYEVSIFPTSKRPANIVYLSLFDEAQSWVEGIEYDEDGSPIGGHAQLKKGQRIRVSGTHSIKHVVDKNTGEHRAYHRVAVNFPEEIVRLHRVKRLPYAQALKMVNAKA